MHSIRQIFLPPPLRTETINIRAIGVREVMSPCIIDRPEHTTDFLLMLFLDPVTIRTKTGIRSFPPNTMMIWDNQHAHYYGNDTQCWLHSWLHCDGTRIRDLLEICGLPVNEPFSLGEPGTVDHYLWEIYREVTAHDLPVEQIVDNALYSWFLDMRRQIDGDIGSVPSPLLAIKHYMGAHFSEPLTLAELAARINLSPSHFSNQFKHFYHISPIEYLIQLRLQYAANLLRDGNMSITEVARAVGYGDAFHFSKQFKRHFGQSPKSMRPKGSAVDCKHTD